MRLHFLLLIFLLPASHGGDGGNRGGGLRGRGPLLLASALFFEPPPATPWSVTVPAPPPAWSAPTGRGGGAAEEWDDGVTADADGDGLCGPRAAAAVAAAARSLRVNGFVVLHAQVSRRETARRGARGSSPLNHSESRR
jgi:hypothetical protein